MAEADTGQNSKPFLVGCCPELSWRATWETTNRRRTKSAEAARKFKPAGVLKSKPHDATTRAELMVALMAGYRLDVVTIPPASKYGR